MHERIRVPDPDFANSKLLIAQFEKAEKGQRTIRTFEAVDSDLYSFDDLNNMIDETYRLWIEILEEREGEARKKSIGSTPMGF